MATLLVPDSIINFIIRTARRAPMSNQAEPTKGPWRASPFSSVVGCVITAQPDPKHNTVRIAGVGGGDRAVTEANAALIASAPAMAAELSVLRARNAELAAALQELIVLIFPPPEFKDFDDEATRQGVVGRARALLTPVTKEG